MACGKAGELVGGGMLDDDDDGLVAVDDVWNVGWMLM